jgi:WhiB family redox-sensing transcriptional regulator
MAEANCLSHPTKLFYPDTGGCKFVVLEAKKVCSACPVWRNCLKFALNSHDGFGIWGGLTVEERKKAQKSGGAHICPTCKLIRVSFTKSIKECDKCVADKKGKYK